MERFLPTQFCKPLQNINKTCTFWADHQPRKTAFPSRSSGQDLHESALPPGLNFRRFLKKSVASPLVHFFSRRLSSLLPFFTLVRSPKNGNATLSRPLPDPQPQRRQTDLSHQHDELAYPPRAVQNLKIRTFQTPLFCPHYASPPALQLSKTKCPYPFPDVARLGLPG